MPLHTRMAQSPWDDASGRTRSTRGLCVVALEPYCALLNSHLASALLGLDMIFFGSLTAPEATSIYVHLLCWFSSSAGLLACTSRRTRLVVCVITTSCPVYRIAV